MRFCPRKNRKRTLGRVSFKVCKWRKVEQVECELLTPCRPSSLPAETSAQNEEADLLRLSVDGLIAASSRTITLAVGDKSRMADPRTT